jgi:hypothetical protein
MWRWMMLLVRTAELPPSLAARETSWCHLHSQFDTTTKHSDPSHCRLHANRIFMSPIDLLSKSRLPLMPLDSETPRKYTGNTMSAFEGGITWKHAFNAYSAVGGRNCEQ